MNEQITQPAQYAPPQQTTPQTSLPPENKSRGSVKKIGLIIGGFILIIIIAQGIYLLFNPNTGMLTKKTGELNQVQNLPSLPQTTSVPSQQQSGKEVIKTDKINEFLQKAESLNLKGDFIEAAEINTTFKGIVESVNFNETATEFRALLVILTQPSGNNLTISLSQKELVKTRFLVTTTGETNEGTWEDISQGDTVSVTTSTNLLNEDLVNSVTFKITKI